jgi:hypothetical protein
MLAGHGGAQNFFSAAGRQSALHAGAVSPHYLLTAHISSGWRIAGR